MAEVAKVYRSSVGKPKMITFYHPKTTKTRPKSHHPHLTCHSPLRVRDSIPNLLPLPPIAVQQHREREYVNDAIKTDVVSFLLFFLEVKMRKHFVYTKY